MDDDDDDDATTAKLSDRLSSSSGNNISRATNRSPTQSQLHRCRDKQKVTVEEEPGIIIVVVVVDGAEQLQCKLILHRATVGGWGHRRKWDHRYE